MTILTTSDKGRFGQTRVRSGAALAMAISGVAFGGPFGAVGDTYVIVSTASSVPVILQYDGPTGNLEGTFATRGGGQFNGMAWSPNGNLYATQQTGNGGWRIPEFDGETGAFIQNVIVHPSGGFSAAKGLTFGPDGDLYIGDFFAQTITRYDGTTFAVKASTPVGEIVGTPSGMHFAPNGNLLVLSGGFNTLREYNTGDGGVEYMGDFASVPDAQQPQDFTWGPNGNIFVTRGAVGGVAEIDGMTGAFIGNFVPANNSLPTNGLAFDDYERFMVSIVFPLSRIDAYDATTGASQGIFITEGLVDVGSVPTIISIKPGASSAGCNDADLAEPFDQLNFIDVSEFLSLFSAGDPSADINGDGSFNFFDVSAFLVTFSAGCP